MICILYISFGELAVGELAPRYPGVECRQLSEAMSWSVFTSLTEIRLFELGQEKSAVSVGHLRDTLRSKDDIMQHNAT